MTRARGEHDGVRGPVRTPVVGVMGSGVRAHRSLAAPLGRGLARMGVHLLTGGGGGVMASVSRAFAETEGRVGLVVGVLPGCAESAGGAPPPGYPNPWVELAVRTHLDARGAGGASSMSRNHVNVLSSDVVVALSGGDGTASEAALALRYGRPLVLLGAAPRPTPREAGLAEGAAPDAAVHVAATAKDALSRVQRLVDAVRAGRGAGPAAPRSHPRAPA